MTSQIAVGGCGILGRHLVRRLEAAGEPVTVACVASVLISFVNLASAGEAFPI